MNVSKQQLSPAEQKDGEARNAKVEKTQAQLDFVAIMVGVDIPEDDEETKMEVDDE